MSNKDYDLKSLVDNRLKVYENKLDNEGWLNNINVKEMTISLDAIKDKLSTTIIKYLLLADSQDIGINLKGLFYFKKLNKGYVGYNTVSGKLKRYERDTKDEILKVLCSDNYMDGLKFIDKNI